MEPLTMTIVAALVAGAVAGAKDVATSAVKDAYAGLKRLIIDKYEGAKSDLEALEAEPDSDLEQQVLAKRLDRAGVGHDEQLRIAAQALLDAVEELKQDPAVAPMFDFERLRVARNLKLSDIEALGTVVRARDTEIQGDFEATGIRQTSSGDARKKA